MLGRRDPPLSEAGAAQAVALADSVADRGLAALWSSPLRRARETAAAVAVVTGLGVGVLDGLAESDRGSWEGARHADLRRKHPELYARFLSADPGFAFPGGESLRSQRERTRDALREVLRGPVPALVVAHAGTIRAALALVGRAVPRESALAHGEVAAELPAVPDRDVLAPP